MQGIELGFS